MWCLRLRHLIYRENFFFIRSKTFQEVFYGTVSKDHVS
jgi:hypothetical protein